MVLAAVAIAACLGDPDLSATSQLVIVADRNPVFVGSAMVGSSVQTSPSILLSPQTQSDDDRIDSISELCADFDLVLPQGGSGIRIYCAGGSGSGTGTASGTNVPMFTGSGSGDSCTPVTYAFDAKFTPVGSGSSSCAVRIAYTSQVSGSAGEYTLVLDGTGVAPSFLLNVSPSSINFGDHPVGATSSGTRVTIANAGSAPLTVNGSNSNSTNFTVTSVGGSTFATQPLGVGSAAAYDVRCAPQALGVLGGTLTFTSAAGPKTVALSCRGIGSSSLSIDPVPAAFASTLVGRAPADVDITITNTGNIPTTLSVSLAAAGSDLTFAPGGNPDGQGLGSGSSTRVTLRYAAAAPQPSGQIGTVTVNYSGAGATPRDIAINAEALVGDVGISPAVVDFGPVCAGSTANKDVMVYASAAGDVQLVSVGAPVAPFDVTASPGLLVGNHGNELALQASVAPTVAGEVSDTLVLSTNLPTTPTREVELRAIALPDGVSPTPEVVHFGAAMIDTTTSAREIALSNCGQAPIQITAARVEGPSASDFAIVSPADPAMTLGQTETATFLVIMNARANGAKQAQVVIDYVGGSVSVPLDGNAFGGDSGDVLDRETYYACSTGGAAGGLPIALALVALRRRRRR